MDLDELRTVQSKERSKDSLQHLRESFYADVADYVADLRERRDRAADRADDPFADPEVRRLSDEIETAEEVAEGLYERRVGKVVKRASLAAMDLGGDPDGLTAEERDLFEELVAEIEANKQDVLDVLAGEASTDSEPSPTAADSTPGEAPATAAGADPEGASATEDAPDVSPADVMGGGSPVDRDADSAARDGSETTASGSASASDSGSRPGAEAEAVVGAGETTDSTPEDGGESSADDDPLSGLAERTTVRLTDDVGEIFGVDERTYDLASEDVVTLPAANAEPLVEQGAAEKLE